MGQTKKNRYNVRKMHQRKIDSELKNAKPGNVFCENVSIFHNFSEDTSNMMEIPKKFSKKHKSKSPPLALRKAKGKIQPARRSSFYYPPVAKRNFITGKKVTKEAGISEKCVDSYNI